SGRYSAKCVPNRRTYRRSARRLASISELAMVVLTPAPERPPAGDRAAMGQTGRDRREAEIGAHRRGSGQTVPPRDAKLALVVAAPAEGSPIRCDETGVQAAGDD